MAPGSLASVPLMAGQAARPLHGQFNKVPVLHSNQPEIVKGSGILVDTQPGSAVAAETQRELRNATYTFNGPFGLHLHHKYYPDNAKLLGGTRQRGALTIAAIGINPGPRPVTLTFHRGSLKNSFEAPYRPNQLMGVKPLGRIPWNTGPGDATAVQMLRGELDRRLPRTVVIPARSRKVILSTELPARGIANGLLRGTSDGQFQMAVVAAEGARSIPDLLSVLDSDQLAPGRIYLERLGEIQRGEVFSRVAGVALGDHYRGSIRHDLRQGALHVPLTSTHKHHFGTRDIQINPLSTRMIDSALNNVGTYGVRYDIDLDLVGAGAHALVLSHPIAEGRGPFTAFRGSIRITTSQGYRDVHVGLRSGQSLPISPLTLIPGETNRVKVSLVYPADATPGHLLSVVPHQQILALNQPQGLDHHVDHAAHPVPRNVRPAAAPPPATAPHNTKAIAGTTAHLHPDDADQDRPRKLAVQSRTPSLMPPAVIMPNRLSTTLQQRYRSAIKAQQEWLERMQGR